MLLSCANTTKLIQEPEFKSRFDYSSVPTQAGLFLMKKSLINPFPAIHLPCYLFSGLFASNQSALNRPFLTSGILSHVCTGQHATIPVSHCMREDTNQLGLQLPNPTRGEAHSAHDLPLSVPSVSRAEAASLGCSPSSSDGVTPFTIFCCTDGGGVGGSDEGGVGGLLRLFWGWGGVLCARWHRETDVISWPHTISATSSSSVPTSTSPRTSSSPKGIAVFLTLVSSWE